MIFRLIYTVIRLIGLIIVYLLIFLIIINTIGTLLLKSPLRKNDYGRPGIYNPYENDQSIKKQFSPKQKKWNKVALHLHSNQVWFSPARDSPENLVQSYKRHGYEWMSISDYNKVTDIRSWNEKSFLSYEWSTSILKRHFLFVGVKSAIMDPFYLFSTRENIQWVIDHHNKQDAFVVANHPTLYDSMSLDFLTSLSGIHAVEIFTPYGDNPRFMDQLLEKGKPIFSMATDDLHYLPQEESDLNHESSYTKFWKQITFVYGNYGQAFERFILIPSSKDTENSIYKSLCKGEYVSVRKFNRHIPDFALKKIQFENETFKIEFLDTVKEIRFITGTINPTVVMKNVSSAEYKMKPEDDYVRAEIWDLRGFLVTNPVYRKERMELRPNCKTNI